MFSPAIPRPAFRRFIILAACLALSTAAFAASATWTSEMALDSSFAFSESPALTAAAVSPSGRAVTVWDRPVGSSGFGFGTNGEVVAAVKLTTTGAWSAPARLSPQGVSAGHAGAVVDPSTGKVSVAWSAGGTLYVSSSSDGISWTASPIPVAAGFFFIPRATLIDVDAKGNVTLVVVRSRAAGDGYDVQAISRSSAGAWRTPVTLNGPTGVVIGAEPGLQVISDGRALLSLGATTFRRDAKGVWSAARNLDLTGIEILDRTSVDMDASGRGYAVIRGVTSNVASLYISTSSATGGWSSPRALASANNLYIGLEVKGSSSGRAMISGMDSANHVRALVTTDGGASWSQPTDFGVGLTPRAAGSETGLYTIAWAGSSTSGFGAYAASGSGVGTAPWAVSQIGTYMRLDSTAVAIAGKTGATTARAAAIWERQGDPASALGGVGATTATVNR